MSRQVSYSLAVRGNDTAKGSNMLISMNLNATMIRFSNVTTSVTAVSFRLFLLFFFFSFFLSFFPFFFLLLLSFFHFFNANEVTTMNTRVNFYFNKVPDLWYKISYIVKLSFYIFIDRENSIFLLSPPPPPPPPSLLIFYLSSFESVNHSLT